MAVHVIDASNPLPPTNGVTALFLWDPSTVILAEGSSISAFGSSASAIIGRAYNTLLLNGSVFSEQWYGIQTGGRTTISATGSVFGGQVGIAINPDSNAGGVNVVNNAGEIRSNGIGIWINSLPGGQNVIVNSGTIDGGTGAIVYNGISNPTDTLSITNTGLIKSTSPMAAIIGPTRGSTVVTNSGRIEGDIRLGGADSDGLVPSTNIYDGRGGSVVGIVRFGDGEDVAFGGDGAETFDMGRGINFVDGGDGVDTLLFQAIAPQTTGATVDLRNTDRQQTTSQSWITIRNIENVVGTGLADSFAGNERNNLLKGERGNDTLAGYGGDDVLQGDAGDDQLSGGSGTDIAVFRADFSAYSLQFRTDGSIVVTDTRGWPTDGQDILTGIEYAQFADRTIVLTPPSNHAPASVSLSATSVGGSAPAGTVVGTLSGTDPDGDPLGYFLVANPGNHFRIHGNQLLVDRAFAGETRVEIVVRASDPSGASIDRLFSIDVTTGQISSGVGTRNLKGGRSGDALTGGAGDDTLNGGLGRDKLIGGAGQDTFAFTTKLGPGNVDRIVDFKHADDTITLAKTVFGNIRKGALSKDAFWTGAHAHDRSDRIIYNSKTGALSYDADGSETKYDPIRFAQLKPMTLLKADDFFVV